MRSREVGVAGAVRAPRATGSSTNRSAASAAGDTAQSPSLFIPWRSRAPSGRAERHPPSAPVGRTGGAELRGRCSMAASCCAQRRVAQSPSLFIPWRSRATSAVPNATRGWEAKPDHHAETSGEIGAAVNHPSLEAPRAREARRRPTAAAPAAPAAIEINKAAANQSPLLSFVYEEPAFQKDVYASAIGLCKDSIIMQSTKPSNSDFWRSFNM